MAYASSVALAERSAETTIGRERSAAELASLGVVWKRETGVLPTRIYAVYRRASTFGQLAGYRQMTMVDDMTDTVLSKGPEYGAIVFDEGNASGRSIAGREVATAMVAALERGDVDGIAAPDIKRLSRDEWLGGGREIAEALRRRRGLLILQGGVELDLRERFHFKFYKQELKAASDEIDEIKFTFYSGMAGRAKLTLEGRVEPMFRYRAPFGYRHIECRDPQTQELIIVRGVVRRTLVKDVAAAEAMETLQGLLRTAVSLGEVSTDLNRRGIVCGLHTQRSKGWTTDKLRTILRNPLYWGEWRLVRDPRSDVWYSYDTGLSRGFPELAYWTEDGAREWQRRFLHQPVQRRMRTYQHPFIGVLACSTCGTLMQGAGHTGYRCGDYNTPGWHPGSCHAPQILADKSAEKALREVFPLVFAPLADRVIDAAEALLSERKDDPLDQQLRLLDDQEQRLIDLAMAGPVTPKMRDARQRITDERQRLEAKRALRDQQPRMSAHEVQALQLIRERPLDVYDRLTPAGQAQVWKLLQAKMVVERTRGRGKYAEFQARAFDPLSDVNIWITLSYMTGEAAGALG